MGISGGTKAGNPADSTLIRNLRVQKLQEIMERFANGIII